MTNITNTWNPSSQNKIDWVEKFKNIFIHQIESDLPLIFNETKFGIHNSLNMYDYCKTEFEEFAIKSEGFGLTMQASIACYDLKDDYFYFSLGKKDDKAVFEAIFKWDEYSNKAIGNQYYFKIEPKTQFMKNLNTGITTTLRRINIKPLKHININAVIQKNLGENTNLSYIELPDYLGGRFYHFTYERINEDSQTYWDDLKIFTNDGKYKHPVLMRGTDHPLFIPDLFPTLSEDKFSFSIKEDIFPVIVYVRTIDNKPHFFKYPKERNWSFDVEIAEICLTDNLSFDWVLVV